MKNENDQCFKWCTARALNPVEKNPEKVTKKLKKQTEVLDWTDIESPVAVDANVYVKIEKNSNVNINVFRYEVKVGVYPLYTSNSMYDQVVDLLYITDGDKKHYCWIQQISSTKNWEKP